MTKVWIDPRRPVRCSAADAAAALLHSWRPLSTSNADNGVNNDADNGMNAGSGGGGGGGDNGTGLPDAAVRRILFLLNPLWFTRFSRQLDILAVEETSNGSGSGSGGGGCDDSGSKSGNVNV
jgi:hypothetical protein